jgi:hypothetical protein
MTFPIGTPQSKLPQGWSLHESTHAELWELEQFYKHQSGGLLLDVLNLGKKDLTDDSLEKVSQRLGFTRKWAVYSLVNSGSLKSVLIVNQSDVGVNLSELLNGITVLVIDTESLPREVLYAAVAQLTGVYQTDTIPLLIYPPAYSDVMHIPSEKKYQLWIIYMRHSNKFLEYVQRHFRMRYE